MAEVFLSIGSNIDRRKHISSCMAQLRETFPDIVFSRIYETPAEGFSGNTFYNLAARHSTDLSWHELANTLKRIEDLHQRDRTAPRFSSRTLDIDLLLYDQLNLQPDVDIPRSEITRYGFVLFPLAEIGDNIIHPILQKTIGELARESSLDRSKLREVSLHDPCL